jgi:hypothetical protein
MIQTKYGTFNGDSWEELCQLIFKSKYMDRHYQEMVASPGDYGIEGFTKLDGVSFQCYCPDKHYTQKELYEKQRDKITKDLGKLRTFKNEIGSRLGSVKLREWIFVTPLITDNKLLKHAQSKQEEVIGWKLPIIDDNFKVILQDADFYAKEINKIQASRGKKITLFSSLDIASASPILNTTEYEENINRKNRVRCIFNGKYNEEKHLRLNAITSKKWLESDSLLKEVEKNASEIYFHVMRVISQYETEVEELCVTWQGEAEELINKVRDELAARIGEAIPSLAEPEIHRLSDQMTSKWLALCPLGIEL